MSQSRISFEDYDGFVEKFKRIPFRVRRRDACRISALDEQREHGKGIFGCGLLLSKAAAAERWHLSEREFEVQRMLGNGA